MGDGILEGIAASQLNTPPVMPPDGTEPRESQRDPGEKPPVIMVLLSDGANTLGSAQPLDAAERAAEEGIPIFAVALGTDDGVATVVDNQGRERRLRVPPDEETLQEIASMTDGEFFSAPTAEELASVYEDLGSKIGYDTETTEITYGFAAAAALLVLAAGGLSLLWFNRFP
jgi:Ca-activated chloride channel family protein